MDSNIVEFKNNRALSKSDEAYTIIEQKIVTMELPPGCLISENDLSRELSIGRTPVREALQRLAAEHLVEIMPRRGIRVTEMNIRQQLRLIEVRRVLEVLEAELAAQRANQEQRVEFGELARAMRETADNNDYMQFVPLDYRYHQLMAEAADNEFSAGMLDQLNGLSHRFWHHHHKQADDLNIAVRLHVRVATAIAEQDVEGARTAATEHMDYIHAFTRSTFDLA
jgi:DNA-binding GntR family transcriptional regulator